MSPMPLDNQKKFLSESEKEGSVFKIKFFKAKL